MGDFSNLANLFRTLPLNNIERYYELLPDKLIVQVNYKESIENISEEEVIKALLYNSTASFALIDNLEGINYSLEGTTYRILRSDVEKWYGHGLPELLKKDGWKSKVQNMLLDNEYVNNFTNVVLKR